MIAGVKKEAVLVFLILALSYAYFYHDPGWNGNSRLDLSFAIVEEGRFTIDTYCDQPNTFTKDLAVNNGHFYTSKAIGSSLVAAVFYLPIYHLGKLLGVHIAVAELKYVLTVLSIGLPSAIAGSLMYVLARQVTGDRFRAFVLTMVANLGTMIFPFSVIFFGHQLAGALLFTAFFLVFQIKKADVLRWKGRVFLIGFLLGFALITEYPVAPIILILTVYYFFVIWRTPWKRSLAVLLPALGALIPIAIVLFYNIAVFEQPIATGYNHSAVPEFQEQQSEGLVGIGWPDPAVIFYLTLHPALGLFWQSPVLILSLIGAWHMWRKSPYRLEAVVSISAFLSLVVLFSGFYNWWGGWTFGPRYIIPMLPFLFLPLVYIPRRWFALVYILGAISIAQMSIAVFGLILIPDDFYKQITEAAYFSYSSIYSYCLPLLANGQFANNIGNKFLGLETWTSVLPLLAGITLLIALFFREKQPRQALPSA